MIEVIHLKEEVKKMILAEKIVTQRKRKGWTQEELAELMGVSRQSVSKWESAQAIPDIKKVLALSELFGVSTDYLFKDELTETEIKTSDEKEEYRRKVTLADAQDFIEQKEKTAKLIALAVMFCIFAPVSFLLLRNFPLQYGNLLSWVFLLVLISGAVGILIYSGAQTEDYKFLNNETFESEYGVSGWVNSRQKKYRPRYVAYNILATCLAILGIIPLLFGAFSKKQEFLNFGVVGLLVIEAVAVGLFIVNGIRWESMEKLLQTGDYQVKLKEKSSRNETIATIYWLSVTAFYVVFSLITGNWGTSWFIWLVAGLLYGILVAVLKLRQKT